MTQPFGTNSGERPSCPPPTGNTVSLSATRTIWDAGQGLVDGGFGGSELFQELKGGLLIMAKTCHFGAKLVPDVRVPGLLERDVAKDNRCVVTGREEDVEDLMSKLVRVLGLDCHLMQEDVFARLPCLFANADAGC